MIVFDLDGTLADCEHRRHFVDPTKSVNHLLQGYDGNGKMIEEAGVYCNIIDGKRFKPDWKSFYEACDQDTIIYPVWKMFVGRLDMGLMKNVQIWSGRCESVRDKTEKWLMKKLSPLGECDLPALKMRSIGDSTPDDVLKERWLDEGISQGNTVDFVFDDRPKVIRMWRRRGIFVFNCCQHDEEF